MRDGARCAQSPDRCSSETSPSGLPTASWETSCSATASRGTLAYSRSTSRGRASRGPCASSCSTRPGGGSSAGIHG
eukprot:12572502-Alexandrium_andersonii.AAC.1